MNLFNQRLQIAVLLFWIPLVGYASSPAPLVVVASDAQGESVKPINQALNDFIWFQGSSTCFFEDTDSYDGCGTRSGGRDMDEIVHERLMEKGPGFANMIRFGMSTAGYDCESGSFYQWQIDDWNQLIDRVQALGSDPIVNIGGTPECMRIDPPHFLIEYIFGSSPGQRPPATKYRDDYQKVQEEFFRILTSDRIAAGKKPLTHIMSLIEPDFFIWFKGYWHEYVRNIFIPTGRAIQTVENETGLDIQFYTAATSSMLPSFFFGTGRINYKEISDMVTTAERENFDLEGIAWNYYGAYPFIGLGHLEFDFGIFNFFQKHVLQRVNPKQSAAIYHEQVSNLKAMYPEKKLLLSEWNIVVGATDDRVHNYENGAFTASSLSAMQDAGLDDAHAYLLHSGSFSYDGSVSPNQQLAGMMNDDGTGDQRWNAFLLWSLLGEEELTVVDGANQPHHDVWSTVSRHKNGDISILVSNFRGVPRYDEGYPVQIKLANFQQKGSTVRTEWIEPGIGDNEAPVVKYLAVESQGDGILIDFWMPNQSAILLRLNEEK